MRRLLYVPIIHDEADMGSAGATLAHQSAAMAGKKRWETHTVIVRGFWESIASYLSSFDVSRLKVYQDGMAVDGETGRRIVEEAAKRGSINYQLIRDLLEKGAELRKTEDPVLLLQEHEGIRTAVQQNSATQDQQTGELRRLQQNRLTEQRDEFIAATINATLREGELGVLFLGAYHNVVARLARDIRVQYVKDPELVRAYFAELLAGHDDRKLEELATHLAAPVLPV